MGDPTSFEWLRKTSGRLKVLAGLLVVAVIAVVGAGRFTARADDVARANAGPAQAAARIDPQDSSNTVELSEEQLGLIQIETAAELSFPIARRAVGSIDFNEDMAAQVFPSYQGRIVRLYAKVGDVVARGQRLLTIESPDLIQAESSLIAASGVLDLTVHALDRARRLFDVQGMAEKDLEQSISDQQTAEGALKAARDAVAVFGKSAAEIDNIVKTRVIDPFLVVPSPIAGRITARNAAPGDFVQPGTLPAPYAVADVSSVWLNASVSESDMPAVKTGQSVHVEIMALPGRTFEGSVATVGATIDPQLHRGLVRAEVRDLQHELLPGMFATFSIVTGAPQVSVGVPFDGVVREGDGTMTVWSTTDRRHFKRRSVKVGLQHDGSDQILEGLSAGEQVVTKGAIFLDNLASGGDS